MHPSTRTREGARGARAKDGAWRAVIAAIRSTVSNAWVDGDDRARIASKEEEASVGFTAKAKAECGPLMLFRAVMELKCRLLGIERVDSSVI
eukprot:scaffold278537_cov31-Tisochrysis_lutea.AAC.3